VSFPTFVVVCEVKTDAADSQHHSGPPSDAPSAKQHERRHARHKPKHVASLHESCSKASEEIHRHTTIAFVTELWELSGATTVPRCLETVLPVLRCRGPKRLPIGGLMADCRRSSSGAVWRSPTSYGSNSTRTSGQPSRHSARLRRQRRAIALTDRPFRSSR
jgi:hypothetical protein